MASAWAVFEFIPISTIRMKITGWGARSAPLMGLSKPYCCHFFGDQNEGI